MKRAVLALAVLVLLAGCSTVSTPENPNEEENFVVEDYSFEKVNANETPDNPEVVSMVSDSEGTTVTIKGTVTVSDGCKTIVVDSPPEKEGNSIKTMIGTKSTGGDMCTQALEKKGYKLTITYSGGQADSVVVSHGGTNSGEHTLTLDEPEE